MALLYVCADIQVILPNTGAANLPASAAREVRSYPAAARTALVMTSTACRSVRPSSRHSERHVQNEAA